VQFGIRLLKIFLRRDLATHLATKLREHPRISAYLLIGKPLCFDGCTCGDQQSHNFVIVATSATADAFLPTIERPSQGGSTETFVLEVYRRLSLQK
jgi:hypothetical protein